MKKWTIRIEVSVSDIWVADGFDMSQRLEELKESIEGMLPYSYGDEVVVKTKILKAPKDIDMAELQNGTVEPKD